MQTNPVKAIREKCLDCCFWQPSEVAACKVEACALYPFRFGKNPYRSKRQLTDEQREALTSRLAEARKARNSSVEGMPDESL